MTTARDVFLPVLDGYRGLLDGFGLRRFSVLVRINTWTGPLPGQGTKTTVDTPLLVGLGTKRPKVDQVNQRDVLASGGLYQDQDLRVGPLTPPWTDANNVTHGTDPASLEPPAPATGAPVEVLFQVSGPGLGTAWYRKVATELVRGNFLFSLVLRKTAETNP